MRGFESAVIDRADLHRPASSSGSLTAPKCSQVMRLSSRLSAGGGTAEKNPPNKQGLTFVHFFAQRKRFLRDRGCS